MKQRIKHFILFVILVALDQLSKYWVKTDLANSDPVVLIPNVLKLQYHTNTGAVWGLMSGKTTFLSIFTAVVMIFIVFLYFKIPSGKKHNPLKIIVVFIMAGAVGNLLDRVLLGHVVDFIYFELINFPLFNFADSCLTVSCIILFLLAVFYYKDEDFAFLDKMFGSKKHAVVNRKDMDDSSLTTGVLMNTMLFDDNRRDENNDSKDDTDPNAEDSDADSTEDTTEAYEDSTDSDSASGDYSDSSSDFSDSSFDSIDTGSSND